MNFTGFLLCMNWSWRERKSWPFFPLKMIQEFFQWAVSGWALLERSYGCVFLACAAGIWAGWSRSSAGHLLWDFFFFSYWSCKTQIPESWYPHQTSELWGWLLLTVHTKTPHVWALPVGVQHLILESVPQRRRYCSDTNVQTPFGTSEKSIICTGTVWDGIMPLYEVYLVLLSDWTPKCHSSLVCPWSMQPVQKKDLFHRYSWNLKQRHGLMDGCYCSVGVWVVTLWN